MYISMSIHFTNRPIRSPEDVSFLISKCSLGKHIDPQHNIYPNFAFIYIYLEI